MEKKTKQQSKEREDLQKCNLNLRERLKVLRTEFKNLIDLNGKNGTIKGDDGPMAVNSDEANNSVSAPTASPVSVATQTMPVAKKAKEEENTSDEEINVDDIGES